MSFLGVLAKSVMICQCCGVEAPTKYVAFYQNIGAIVMRFGKSVEGNLCKSCIHSNFWNLTGTTAVLGWWGAISFVLTPCFLLNNTCRYLFCLGMPPVPPGATAPRLTDEVAQRIIPHLQQLFDRVRAGEDMNQAVETTAMTAGATPGQVMLLVRAVLHQQQQEQNR
jgi:hypothetical protein